MSLNRQIKQFKITANSNSYILNGQNFVYSADPVYYTGSQYDEALSGFLRQNFRGYRLKFSYSYNSSIEAGEYRSLLNDLVTDFTTNNIDSVTLTPDNGKADTIEVVIDDLGYQTQYQSTFGTFAPTLGLVSVNIQSTIPSWFEGP